MRPVPRRMKALALAIAGVMLNACGGGGSGSDDDPSGGTTFPLRSAVISSLKTGSSGNYIVSGYCNGSAYQTSSPAFAAAVPAAFGEVNGFSVVTTETIYLRDCTPSVLSTTTTSYYDARYAALGIVSSDGSSGKYSTPVMLPETVRIGDAAELGRLTYYSDMNWSVPNGYDDISLTVYRDGTSTAIINRKARSYAMDGSLQQTDQERSHLSAAGTLAFVSHEFQSHIGNQQYLLLTPGPLAPPPAPAAPMPAPAPARPPSAAPTPPPSPPPSPPPVSLPDTVRPTVLSVRPASGASRTSPRGAVTVGFSEEMNPATLSSATFSLRVDGVPVPGTVSYSSATATFNPASPLRGATVYTASLAAGIADTSGNTLAAGMNWSFTTNAASPVVPLAQSVAYRGDYGHTGSVRFGAPLDLPRSPTWSLTLPGNVSYPLIAGNRVFVTSAGLNGGYGTQLHALDSTTGATVWGPIAIPGTYFSSGIAYDQGKLFVLNYDGLLRTFDAATGAEGWSVRLPMQYSFTAPPIAVDGMVYATGAGSGGTVYAIDATSGDVLWHAPMSIHGGSPAVDGDGVFVSYACVVQKLDAATGASRWTYAGDCTHVGDVGTLVATNGAVYARHASGSSGVILDSTTGTPTGTFASGSPSSMPAISAQSEVYLVDGTVRAVDAASRAVRWSFAGDGQLTSAPLLIDQTVIIGSESGTLYALDAMTGAQLWSGLGGAPVSDHSWQMQTGLAAGEGFLMVPAGNVLTGWKLRP